MSLCVAILPSLMRQSSVEMGTNKRMYVEMEWRENLDHSSFKYSKVWGKEAGRDK